MTTDFLLGQYVICLLVLTILIVSIALNRRQDASLSALLCASIAHLSAVGLRIIGWTFDDWADQVHLTAVRTLSVLLCAAALAVLLLSFFLWKEGKRTLFHWLALLTALSPLWLAGLYWAITHSLAFFFGALTLSLFIAFCFYQWELGTQLERDAVAVKRQQAVLLQEQMQPHFIFNALTSLRELCDTDPARAAAGLDNLSGYLRKNLDALTADQLIPFTRELEHVEEYVALEKLNRGGSFEVVYDLAVMDFYLPALSVQPLVENAIHHGVRGMERDGMVIVTTEQRGSMIRIIVEDNGPGFPDGMSERQRQRVSHGLENVRRRLETQCGGSLHIHSDGSGSRLVLLLPKRSAPC